jgi:hypothetical protein
MTYKNWLIVGICIAAVSILIGGAGAVVEIAGMFYAAQYDNSSELAGVFSGARNAFNFLIFGAAGTLTGIIIIASGSLTAARQNKAAGDSSK